MFAKWGCPWGRWLSPQGAGRAQDSKWGARGPSRGAAASLTWNLPVGEGASGASWEQAVPSFLREFKRTAASVWGGRGTQERGDLEVRETRWWGLEGPGPVSFSEG